MTQKIQFRYFNHALQIGIVNLKNVYQLPPQLTQLKPEVYNGRLVFRAKGSAKRISYSQIKSGLIKTTKCIFEDVPNWL